MAFLNCNKNVCKLQGIGESVWTDDEARLFSLANLYNNTARYTQALQVSGQLLDQVAGNNIKTIYVGGCRYAVALAHLRRIAEADWAFNQAYERAMFLNEYALGAYVQMDRLAIRHGDEAIQMARLAVWLLKKAESTPDPERALKADREFANAVLARTVDLYGVKKNQAVKALSKSAGALRRYAYGEYPRYKHAYLIALTWLLRSYRRRGLIKFLPGLVVSSKILIEVIRQKKARLLLKALLKH